MQNQRWFCRGWKSPAVSQLPLKPWLTIAAITQVGPDDVLLREAEDPETASSHSGINDDTSVCHHLRTLIETNSVATADGSKMTSKKILSGVAVL